jgi:hypothetical protein
MRFLQFLLFVTVILTSVSSAVQERSASTPSVVPDPARYQVVQSLILAKLTFRLDRFTGATWQFAKKAGDGYTWQQIRRIDVINDTKLNSKVIYQIFLSAIRALVTVLINTNTGASWVITEDPKEGIVWSPTN